MSKPSIVFLMGVSGSGKTTVMNALLEDERLDYIPSYTSRPLREGEINGEKYWHISLKEYEKSITSGEFLEYAVVHGTHYYGTKLAPLQEAVQNNRIPIKEIDIQGLENITQGKKLSADQYTTIFLNIDEVVMTQRILHRQPDIAVDELERRLESGEIERHKARDLCDHIINADQPLTQVVQEVRTIIFGT